MEWGQALGWERGNEAASRKLCKRLPPLRTRPDRVFSGVVLVAAIFRNDGDLHHLGRFQILVRPRYQHVLAQGQEVMDKCVEVGADRRRLGRVLAILHPMPDWLAELLIWIAPEVLNHKPAAVALWLIHRLTHGDCFLDPRDRFD